MIRLGIIGSTLGMTLLVSACGGNSNSGGDCEANLLAGDLVITEIHANPEGADEGLEYFEIFNATTAPIDLTGLALISSRDDMTDEDVHTMREATINAGQYFVVGGILDEFKEPYMDYGAAADLSFRNSNGRLALRCKDVVVDETTYAEAPSGASLELNGAEAPNHIRNDEQANYCEASVEFAPDFLGSPQMANGVCGNVVPGTCDDNGTMRPTNAPALGDVIITELMPNPEGPDGDGEWIEVLALGEFDINGLTVGRADGGSGAPGTVSDAACVTVSAGDHFIFASNDDTATNGGLPAPVATFGFSLLQSDGAVQISLGETILDTVTWPASSSGVSINLDPGSNDPVSNDDAGNFCPGSQAYGDAGNLGTPGAANSACVLGNTCLDGGTPRDIDPPGAGEVEISEWMANPAAVADNQGEWFEVRALAAFDLNGFQLGSDAGTVLQTVTSADCIPVTAGTHLVFGRQSDMALNGGLPRFDGTAFNLGNGDDNIFVGFGDVVLDMVAISTAANGVSTQKDADGDECDTDTLVVVPTYGDGDTGSPGDANDDCP